MSLDAVQQWSFDIGTQSFSGWSPTATALKKRVAEERRSLDQTVTFGAKREAILTELIEVFADVGNEGWDGYQAVPVAPETYMNACNVAESLPAGIPVPTVGAEPDGQLTFEWYSNPRRLLSVSVTPEGDLHYAALIGGSKAYGTEPFFGTMPHRILELARRVTSR